MTIKAILILAVLAATPAWSQTEPNTPGNPQNESPMLAPPPVSGEAFPAGVLSEARSNYLSVGVNGSAAYVSNLEPGEYAKAIADEMYTVNPVVRFDRTTGRMHGSLSYAPGFIFYQHTSVLNQASQMANGAVEFQPTEHTHAVFTDTFDKTSSAFSEPYSLTSGGVSGSLPVSQTPLLAPFADEISNAGDGEYRYQFGRNSMVGGGGGVSELDFPNPTQSPGLYNSSGYDVTGFYNGRLSKRQYYGASATYSNVTEYPPPGQNQTETATTSISPFYTFFLRQNISFSVTGGPQFYKTTQAPLSPVSGTSPSLSVSMNARASLATVSVAYQRLVGAGGGLVGTFSVNNGSANVALRMGRNWSLGAAGNYSDDKNVLPAGFASEPGAHMLTIGGSVQRTLGPHLDAEMGFSHMDERYGGTPVGGSTPISDRVYVSIGYTLRRPLGR